MFIKNDICYAGTYEDNIKITEAKALRGHMLLVTFSTGERRLFDATQLTGEAFKPLNDESVFANFTIFHGVITWLNGEVDVAPEWIYQNSFSYDYEIA